MNENKALTAHQHVGAGLASLVWAALAVALCLKIRWPASYADFIVGSIAWEAGSKFQDLVAVPVAVGVFSLAFWWFSSLSSRIAALTEMEDAQSLSDQWILWSLPALVGLAGMLLVARMDEWLLLLSAAGTGLLALPRFWFRQKRRVSSADLGQMLFFTLTACLWPLAVMLVVGRLSPEWMSGQVLHTALVCCVVFGGCVLVGLIFHAKWWPAHFAKALPLYALVGQLPLPLLFATLLPAALSPVLGPLAHYSTSPWLTALVLLLVVGGVTDVLVRWRAATTHGMVARDLVSPLAMLALFAAWRFGVTFPPDISADDYHFGEGLIGVWTLSKGWVPYVDYMPSHGLVSNYFVSGISALFFDGTAATIHESGRVALFLLSALAMWSMYKWSGSLLLALVSVFMLGEPYQQLHWLFFVPFVCLWLSRRLWQQPAWWLTAWLVSMPVVVLGVPGQGLLLVAASGPLAAYMGLRLWQSLSPAKWLWPGTAVVLLALMAVATPLGAMCLGALRYVLENGVINQVAYGVTWTTSWTPGGSQMPLEFVRMSWVVVPVLCLVLVHRYARMSPLPWLDLLAVCFALLFVLLLVPYTMGRIDPSVVSRPGVVGLFSWLVLVPLVGWRLVVPHWRVQMVAVLACVAASLNLWPLSVQGTFLAAMAPSMPTQSLRDGPAAGMARVGHGHVSDAHWARLTKLSAVLDRHLDPQEPYWDLSSRGAHHFYFNRLPAVAVPAAYNLVSLGEQRRALARLQAKPPRLVVLEADNINHDGGGVPLRNALLYRFVLEHYRIFKEDGFVLGSRISPVSSDGNKASIGLAQDAAAMLDSVLLEKDLRKIPLAWGQSALQLSRRMVTVATFDRETLFTHDISPAASGFNVDGIDPYVSIDLAALNLKGRDAGLLKFDFSCTNGTEAPRLQVFWWGDQQNLPVASQSFRFTGGRGTVIVPLDSSATWLASSHLRGVRIDLDNPEACPSFQLDQISLAQRLF